MIKLFFFFFFAGEKGVPTVPGTELGSGRTMENQTETDRYLSSETLLFSGGIRQAHQCNKHPKLSQQDGLYKMRGGNDKLMSLVQLSRETWPSAAQVKQRGQ